MMQKRYSDDKRLFQCIFQHLTLINYFKYLFLKIQTYSTNKINLISFHSYVMHISICFLIYIIENSQYIIPCMFYLIFLKYFFSLYPFKHRLYRKNRSVCNIFAFFFNTKIEEFIDNLMVPSLYCLPKEYSVAFFL